MATEKQNDQTERDESDNDDAMELMAMLLENIRSEKTQKEIVRRFLLRNSWILHIEIGHRLIAENN